MLARKCMANWQSFCERCCFSLFLNWKSGCVEEENHWVGSVKWIIGLEEDFAKVTWTLRPSCLCGVFPDYVNAINLNPKSFLYASVTCKMQQRNTVLRGAWAQVSAEGREWLSGVFLFCFVFEWSLWKGSLLRDLQCPRLRNYMKIWPVPCSCSVAVSSGLVAFGTDVKVHQERDNRKLL